MNSLFETEEPEPVTVARYDDIRKVFAHWRERGHPRAYPNPHPGMKEWQKIAARLKDGYSVGDLSRAIDGIHASPFHNGENDRNKSYVSLELCMRDATHVEQFLGIAAEQAEGKPVLSETTLKSARAGQSWAERKKQQLQALQGPTQPAIEHKPTDPQ